MHISALSRPIHVLVADAESLVRWALAQALTAQGCTVTDVSSATGALQLLSRPHPEFDVIVLDHCLSDTHDLTLLETARALSPRSRIVMLTACMPPERAAEAYRCGAQAVIEKPVDLDALVAVVTTPSGSG
jgi:ATP-dependent Lon protease